MVPEAIYGEECAVEVDRSLLLALQRKYEDRHKARVNCRQCLLALGVDPNTGRSNHRGSKHVPSICKGVRTQKRVKNKFSKEEMGTIGNYVGVVRWDNSYITKACYRKKLW